MSTPSPTPAPAPTTPRPTFARPSLARLAAVEVRKVLDTRTGRWFLAGIAALVVLALANNLRQAEGSVVLVDALNNPGAVLRTLLPVLGVLSMTGEWTQRTALTTFALVPQRGRVLVAKLVALLTITLVAVAATAAACVLGVAATASLTDRSADLSGATGAVGGMLVEVALWMLMGAGFGALLHSTAAALVAFLVLPTAASVAAVVALGAEPSAWVTITVALGDASDLHLDAPVAPTLTAIALWVVVPLVAGTVRTLRRQVS